MKTSLNSIVLLTMAWSVGPAAALNVPPPRRVTTSLHSTMEPPSSSKLDDDAMREEIARMKQEAQRRLDALSRELSSARSAKSVLSTVAQDSRTDDKLIVDDQHKDDTTITVVNEAASQKAKKANHAPVTIEDLKPSTKSKKDAAQTNGALKNMGTNEYLKRLENTRWRIMLNIGREPGTWMGKTWGASGDRLLLNLEVELTDTALMDHDDFLNGRSNAKVLRVANNELTLSPNLEEGSRKVHVRSGGWRLALGEGPMGTDVLRFFFDVAEEVRHRGSDVYAPAGRIYCTCGYFPAPGHRREAITETSATSSKPIGLSLKEEVRQEQMALNAEYERLSNEMDRDTSLVSWEKMMRAREMMNLRNEAKILNERMTEARIREPKRSLLRLSRDQTIGLTREGGVCCKVSKGMAVEYHILGKFEVAAMDNREHSDYRTLLP